MTVEPKKAEFSEESIDAKVKQFISVKDVAATIGLIALPAFSLRVLSVSHYDLNTALALLQNSPLVSFTYANFVTIIPLLSYVAGVAILIHQQRRYPINRRQPRTWLGAASTYTLSLLLFLPSGMMQTAFASLFIWVLIFPLFFVYGLPSHIRPSLVVALLVFLYFSVAYRPLMWLPPENLNVDGKVQTVYVLQPQDSDLVVFDPDHRTVVRISKPSIKSRVYCDNGSTGQISEILLPQPIGRPMCANYHPSTTR